MRTARSIPLDKAQLGHLAHTLAEHLPKLLRVKYPENTVLDSLGPSLPRLGFEVGVLQTISAMGTPVNIPVRAQWITDARWFRRYVDGGMVKSHAHTVGGRAFPYELVLNLNPKVPVQEYHDNKASVEKEAFNVLVHEATHAADWLRHHAEKLKTEDTYHNDPSEARAFTAQIIEEVLDYVRKQAEDCGDLIGTKHNHPPSWLIEEALASSKTWLRVSPAWTEANRRRATTNIYKALDEEWPDFQGLYPPDPEDDFAPEPFPWLERSAFRVARRYLSQK